jgi:hypothetical protein
MLCNTALPIVQTFDSAQALHDKSETVRLVAAP